jgi:MoxR-like ATPase
MESPGPAPLRQAADRFVAFFRELSQTFIEREDLLTQIALALLSRQHVLMTGPPGTAKSQMAHAVLGRIVSKETGRSSLFARQFTESTVQTDLVGPIDFKTLMESGRTEHFTDEGILGAVHAFLDEVFDGRDMLLRSTLNLLQERELKEGTKITPGKIECALMTSNRYLAEILDNDRLVAFVDRIAFLCFVPKGFGSPQGLEAVLAAQVAGQKPPPLTARLTIEDLDVLQAAAETVYVDETICASLAALVRSFELELGAARRADPAFAPSRYLSTRTAVRMGTLLRAICLHDWMFGDGTRTMEVLPKDLAGLRFGLTLCGPAPAHAAQLLMVEADPRERRQLAIARTEREIFDRCLAGLPPAMQVAAPKRVSRELLAEAAPQALAQHPSSKLLALSRALAVAATSGLRGADEARASLEATLQVLVERALRFGLSVGASDSIEPAGIAAELAELANDVERAGRAHVHAARWLRARALDVIDETLRLGAAPIGETLVTSLSASGDLESLRAVLDAALGRLERLRDLHQGLRHAGADEADPAARDRAWAAAAARLVDALGPMLQRGLLAVGTVLLTKAGPPAGLTGHLAALQPALALARAGATRLGRLGADGEAVFARTLAPLVVPLARRAYQGAGGATLEERLAALERQSAELGAAGLLPLLAPGDVMDWSLAALLRLPEPPPAGDDAGPPDLPGYRRLRRAMPRATLASLVVDLYLRVVPGGGRNPDELRDPDLVVRRVADLVKGLGAETREALSRRDLAYLEAPLAYLERWWGELAASLPAEPRAATEILARSRFFEITHDDAALARFALEARLCALVVEPAPVQPLLARLEALEHESAGLAGKLLAARPGPGASAAAATPAEPAPPAEARVRQAK